MKTILTVVALIWGWTYLLDGEGDMCRARMKFVARQAPFALEILAARHPLSVGLVRTLLNEKGGLDQFVQAQILSVNSSDGSLACALQTAILHFKADELRVQIAQSLETGLGIKDYP